MIIFVACKKNCLGFGKNEEIVAMGAVQVFWNFLYS